MIRRPPRSTLFPTRRSSDLMVVQRQAHRLPAFQRLAVQLHRADDALAVGGRLAVAHVAETVDQDFQRRLALRRRRSEEHTSELQSHVNLVCRLLLEKKKTTQ